MALSSPSRRASRYACCVGQLGVASALLNSCVLLLACLLCAALLGAMKAEIGVSIMHDANHGAYSRSTLFGRIMGATLDVAGASRCAHARSSRYNSALA